MPRPLTTDEIMQVLNDEIMWCEKNPDKAFHAEYRKGFVNGLIQAKYLITGAEEMLGDDPGPLITNEGTCSNCGYKLELDDLHMLDFDVEESGVQPGTVHGPAVHWARGTIGCPQCKVRLPFETSSD